MIKLRVNSSLCTGCMNCEAVCSLFRSGRQDPSASAIRVELELFSGRHGHIWCRQCENAPCEAECPTNAITRNSTTGALEIDRSICIHCGSCAKACTFHAIFHSQREECPVKCDLCKGDPQCARACTFNAITVERTIN